MLMGALRRFAVVLLCVVFGVLVFGCVGAWGALQYPLLRQLSGLEGSSAIAVDAKSGDTLVGGADQELQEEVVRVFDATGSLVATWTGANTPAGGFGQHLIYSIAANEATGDVYVADRSHGVVDVFEASGGYVCQITGAGSATTSASECDASAPGTPAGVFGEGEPAAVTVDQATGELYVFDSVHRVVDVFNAGGAYLRQVTAAGAPSGSFESSRSMAVNDSSGDLLVAEGETIRMFAATTGAYLETWDGSAASNPPGTPSGSFAGVAVAANDATGVVFNADGGNRVVEQLAAGGGYLGQIAGIAGAGGFSSPQNVAVEQATGDVYVLDGATPPVVDVFGGTQVVVPDVRTGVASGVGATSVTMNGTVNPDGVEVKSCRFEYGTSAAYGGSVGCVESVGSGTGEVSVHADLAGLSPATAYHFRLVAGNENGTEYGQDAEVTTLPLPTIGDIESSNVAAGSADLAAQIDPNGYDTTYRFEYGTTSAYGSSQPVPDGDLGAGSSGVPVTVHLTGLSANTTYHWRVVATSANGTAATGDQTFVYDTGGGGLPDGRAYEMVTPAQKNGAWISPLFASRMPAVAESGSRVVDVVDQCFGDAVSCPANRSSVIGTVYEFTRTSAGWIANALAPAAEGGESNTIKAMSPDTGMALFNVPTAPTYEDDLIARQADGSFLDVGPVTPPAAGRGVTSEVTTATADLSHVVFTLEFGPGQELWSFGPQLARAYGGTNNMYEYAGTGNSQPVLVGVSGGAGSSSLISACDTILGGNTTTTRNALSADGSTVFFTAENCASGTGANAGVAVPANTLYARIDESQTVLLSGRSAAGCTTAACLSSPVGSADYEGAAADGSRVFFTSTQQLTDSASEDSSEGTANLYCRQTKGANGCNLYEYDLFGPVGRGLIDVSAGDSSGGGPRVRGVEGVSADGSHVYFIARGVLTLAPNNGGQRAQDGGENLYVFEHDATYPEGHLAFIATLAKQDRMAIQAYDPANGILANVTPDGRFLVFTSGADLTSDDSSTTGAEQVFRYDAVTGQLIRISIGENGFNDNGNANPLGASVAQASDVDATEPVRGDPTMSNDGSYVFFESPVGLTAQALNDVQSGVGLEGQQPGQQPVYAENVYEYHEGHVYLISDGHDASGDVSEFCESSSSVCLLGTDATGANVFFTTADQLVPQDTDTQLDVYDARICTAVSPCIAPPATPVPCQGEACHGTPAGAPAAVGAASSVFSGPGNLVQPAAPTVAPKKAKKVKAKRKGKPKQAKRRTKRRRSKTRRSSSAGRVHNTRTRGGK
jgi:hypothetical protein